MCNQQDLYIPYKRSSGPSLNEYVVNFIRDHRSDLLLAGLIGLSLSMLSGIVLYRVLFAGSQKKVQQIGNSSGEQPLTVLHVELESEVKAAPPQPNNSCNEFVPPPTPPPKYSDVVQTV